MQRKIEFRPKNCPPLPAKRRSFNDAFANLFWGRGERNCFVQSTGKGLRGTFPSQRPFVPVVSSERRHQASTLSGCVGSNSVFVIRSIFNSRFCVSVHLDSSSLNEAQNPKRVIGSSILSDPEPVIASFSLLKHNFGQKEEKTGGMFNRVACGTYLDKY